MSVETDLNIIGQTVQGADQNIAGGLFSVQGDPEILFDVDGRITVHLINALRERDGVCTARRMDGSSEETCQKQCCTQACNDAQHMFSCSQNHTLL